MHLRTLAALTGVFALLLISFGCGDQSDNQSELTDKGAAASAEATVNIPAKEQAKQLWLNDLTWYETWEIMPGTVQGQESSGNPHSDYGTVLGNDIAVATVRGDHTRMPNGAIVIRENLNVDREIIRLSVMSKRDDGWFFAVYTPRGDVELAGKLDTCIECHNEAARDNLYFWTRNQELERQQQ